MKEIKEITWQEWVADAPLYAEFSLTGLEPREVFEVLCGRGTVDAYCPECDAPSVYRFGIDGWQWEEKLKQTPSYGVILIEGKCARRRSASFEGVCGNGLTVCFLRKGESLLKIGQHPSRATLDFGALPREFRLELDPSLRKQLGTAIGLRGHGVGIGSFAYLRRIIEHLLGEAHDQAKGSSGWDEGAYQRSRVEEKIELLSDFLPSRLVRTAKAYSILSKGLHELDENECLVHFDLILNAIGLILRQRLEEHEFDEAQQKVLDSHAQLSSRAKGNHESGHPEGTS